MSSYSPTAPAGHNPPWWVVVLTIPLFGAAILLMFGAGISGFSLVDSVSAHKSETQVAPLIPGGSVVINATSGGMVIEPGSDGEVSVTDSMTVNSPTRALARQALDTFRRSSIAHGAGGDTVTIPTPEDFNLLAFKLDRQVTVKVPIAAALTLRGRQVAVDVHQLTGNLDLQVGAGAVRLKDVVVSGADRVTASAGAIDFEGSLAGGSLDVETTAGAINIVLPAGTNATYDVATTNGAIFVQPEHGSATSMAGGGSRSATGVFGDGGAASLRLRAVNGAIAVNVGNVGSSGA
jgi:hypothetical protein